MSSNFLQAWHAVHDVHREAEAVRIVVNGEFERGIDISLLFVAANMDVVMICAAVGESMDQLRVPVKIEHDGFIDCEERIEIAIRESVRMLTGRLQLEEIHDVNETDFKVREFFAQQRNRC